MEWSGRHGRFFYFYAVYVVSAVYAAKGLLNSRVKGKQVN